MGPSEDRRRFPRLRKTAALQTQLLSYSNPQPIIELAACMDISKGGLRFRTTENYPEGTLLKIKAEIPGWGHDPGAFDPVSGRENQFLVALGTVVRTDGSPPDHYDIALQFMELLESDHRALVSLVDQMCEMEKLEQKD